MTHTRRNWRKPTIYVVWFTLFGVLLWDAVAKQFGGMGSTVSSLMFDLAYEWPIVTFMAGLLCGHFFFSMWGRESKQMRDAIMRGAHDDELARLARENFGV